MNRLFILLVGCSLLGCELVQPKIEVKVPPNVGYEPLLAWVMAESKETLVPTPNPEPNPDPSNLKDGDDCPKCDKGFRPGDGTVRPRCVSCNGDGICNTGDPILLPQEISIVVSEKTDVVKQELAELRSSLDELRKQMEETRCTCNDKTEDEPVKENIIPEPQYKDVDWYYIYKDGDYCFWYEDTKSFTSKAGVTVKNLSGSIDIANTPNVTICHGNHCLNHKIYKLTSKVEVPSGGQPDNQLQDGTGGK